MSVLGCCFASLDLINHVYAIYHLAENRLAPTLISLASVIQKMIIAYIDEKL